MESLKLGTLKGQVECVLRDVEESRNSDTKLAIEIWRRFHPDKLIMDGNAVHLIHLLDLPSQDSIKRFRAYFQNSEYKYLPTDERVAKARGWMANEWKRALGYTVEEDTGQLKMGVS